MLTFKRLDEKKAEIVRPWFADQETRQRLGDEHWLDLYSGIPDTHTFADFRGAKVTAKHAWLVYDGDFPVGCIVADVMDKYVEYGGLNEQGEPVRLKTLDKTTSSIAFLVNPDARSKGYAARIIKSMLSRPELSDVQLFIAGVEPDNLVSKKVLASAGFRSNNKPDFEGIIYYSLQKT